MLETPFAIGVPEAGSEQLSMVTRIGCTSTVAVAAVALDFLKDLAFYMPKFDLSPNMCPVNLYTMQTHGVGKDTCASI